MKGKHICEELKRIRKEIASRNDIDYTPAECTHEGDCAGVCPTCEREAAYIMEELEKRIEAGLPVDIDEGFDDRIDALEQKRSLLNNPDLDEIVYDGIVPDSDLLTGMQEAPETFILQGDVANPEGWNDEEDEEDDVENSKD